MKIMVERWDSLSVSDVLRNILFTLLRRWDGVWARAGAATSDNRFVGPAESLLPSVNYISPTSLTPLEHLELLICFCVSRTPPFSLIHIGNITHNHNNKKIWYQDGLGRAKNPVKYLQSIEQRARERQVAVETVRLLRQDVIACYRKEGVNHYENCKEPVERYVRLVLKRDVGQVNPTYKDDGKNYGFNWNV